MRAGIVICSRIGSSRLPGKSIRPLNGEPLIRQLIKRLLPAGLPIVLAIPPGEQAEFRNALGPAITDRLYFFEGWPDCPLSRMSDAATTVGLDDAVIRICTDKIFVRHEDITRFVSIFENSDLDYLFSSNFLPGTGFEMIRTSTLAEAAERFDNVEHISYAARAITKKICDVPIIRPPGRYRLLVDFPRDIEVIEEVLRVNGNECSSAKAIEFIARNAYVAERNRLPKLTLYTCAYNAEKWIGEAIRSVLAQGFLDFEYLLIDDASTDRTTALMKCHAWDFEERGLRYLRNEKNLGLASSSNVALANARGDYIMRLDADDYFTASDALEDMVATIEHQHTDAVYPDHYFGSMDTIVTGGADHHVGGAIFSTKALHFLKFQEGLRGFDSYDLFRRAGETLRVGYRHRPTFFYRQHPTSLSKQDPEMRAKIKEEIDAREP